MFDIGWPELMVVAIVLVVVVGPKDLPRMLRTFGKTTNKLRSMAGDFRRQFDDALKEAELDDVKSIVEDARKLDPTAEIKKHLNPMQQAGEQIKAGLDQAMKPTPKPESGSKAASAAVADKAASAAVADKAASAAVAGKAVKSKVTAGGAAKKTPATAKKTSVAAKKTNTAAKPAARAKPATAAKKPTVKKTASKTTGTKKAPASRARGKNSAGKPTGAAN